MPRGRQESLTRELQGQGPEGWMWVNLEGSALNVLGGVLLGMLSPVSDCVRTCDTDLGKKISRTSEKSSL